MYETVKDPFGISPSDDIINETTVNPNETREAARQDFNFFAALALPEVVKSLFSPVHSVIWNLLVQGLLDTTKSFHRFALGIPRGHAKTTLAKLYIVFIILFTKRKNILVVCSISINAENFIADIMHILEEDNIKKLFGLWSQNYRTDRNDFKEFYFNDRWVQLHARGAMTSVRGLNKNNARPDVIICDDMQTQENASSPVSAKELETWFIGTLLKTKAPDGCEFIYIGNMYPDEGCLLAKLETNPEWTSFISGALLADGSVIWPEVHSKESLLSELASDTAMGREDIFFSEVQNLREFQSTSGLDSSAMSVVPIYNPFESTGNYIIVDPSAGIGKDKAVITSVCIPTSRESIVYSIEASSKWDQETLIKKAFEAAITISSSVIFFEATAYQQTLGFWFDKIGKELNITTVKAIPLQAGKLSKPTRILSSFRMIEHGTIKFYSSTHGLYLSQAIKYNRLKKNNEDDILDTVAYIPQIMAKYLNDIAPPIQIEEDINDGEASVWNESLTNIF